MLVAWGIDTDGKPVFLGLAPGAAESTDAWRALLADLIDRGWAARCWSSPTAARAWARRSSAASRPAWTSAVWSRSAATSSPRSPTHAQDQVKRDSWAVLDDIEHDGQAAVAEARRRAKRFIAKWRPLYPTAVAWVADNLEALVVHLLFPAVHRKRIRHSNLIERTFGEPAAGSR